MEFVLINAVFLLMTFLMQTSAQLETGDSINPIAICPRDITTHATEDSNTTAMVAFNVTCTDNVDEDIQPTCNATENETLFPVGVTTVACSCEDDHENRNHCSFRVNVEEANRPIAICPSDITTHANKDSNTTATVDFNVRCTDNVDRDIQPTCNATQNETLFPIGITGVKCVCRDSYGNRNRCFFIVVVEDASPPNAICPSDISTHATEDSHTTAMVDFNVRCRDNVDRDIQPTCNATANDTLFPVGVTTVACSCEDDYENTNHCLFRVNVEDANSPNAICPIDITTYATKDANTTAIVSFHVRCTDNIDVNVRPTCNATENETLFPVGVTTVVCSCQDSHDNTNNCSFRVSVKDANKPIAICPSDITTHANKDSNTTATADFHAQCTDKVDVDIQPTCNATENETLFPVGVTTIACSCEDDYGNTNHCSFRVIVEDESEPTVTCPRDIVVNITDESSRSATADFLVSCSDHIDGLIHPNCNATTNITPFLIGETYVSCSCQDNSGNTGECSFKVTVKDLTAPAATCPRDIVVNITDESSRSTTANFLVLCSDHIDGGIQPICNATANVTPFLIGETSVSCSCEDNSGNTMECSFKVTVRAVENMHLQLSSLSVEDGYASISAEWSYSDSAKIFLNIEEQNITIHQLDWDRCVISSGEVFQEALDTVTRTFAKPSVRANSLYNVTVTAKTSTGVYHQWNQIRTDTSRPTGEPYNLSRIYKSRRLHLSIFRWDKPICGQRNGRIIGFDYVIQRSSGPEQMGRTFRKFRLLTSLQANEIYSLQISAVTEKGKGPAATFEDIF